MSSIVELEFTQEVLLYLSAWPLSSGCYALVVRYLTPKRTHKLKMNLLINCLSSFDSKNTRYYVGYKPVIEENVCYVRRSLIRCGNRSGQFQKSVFGNLQVLIVLRGFWRWSECIFVDKIEKSGSKEGFHFTSMVWLWIVQGILYAFANNSFYVLEHFWPSKFASQRGGHVSWVGMFRNRFMVR